MAVFPKAQDPLIKAAGEHLTDPRNRTPPFRKDHMNLVCKAALMCRTDSLSPIEDLMMDDADTPVAPSGSDLRLGCNI